MYKIILKIDGMRCPMCETYINDTVRKAYKVKKVKSAYKKNTVIILTETNDINIFIESIEKKGYKVLEKEIEEG